MQYVVHAYDPPDSLDHRMAIRERHLEGIRQMKAEGTFHLGGALLDPEGRMIGSMMLVEFETPEELQSWLDHEPYLQEGVWEKVDIKPFRMAAV